MVKLQELSRDELELLAKSRFGVLKPKQVPADWRKQLDEGPELTEDKVPDDDM